MEWKEFEDFKAALISTKSSGGEIEGTFETRLTGPVPPHAVFTVCVKIKDFSEATKSEIEKRLWEQFNKEHDDGLDDRNEAFKDAAR